MTQLVLFFLATVVITAITGCIPGLPQPDVDIGNTSLPPQGLEASQNDAPVVNFHINPTIVVNGTGEVTQTEIPVPQGMVDVSTGAAAEPPPVAVYDYPFPNKGDPYDELEPITEEQRRLGEFD